MQNTNLEIENSFLEIIYIIFTIMAGLVLPALLILFVKFTGYSEIIEEISKGLIVFFLILNLSSYKTKIFIGIVFGFLFGLSESMFYLNNIFQLGDFGVFWQRLLWTVPMHIITVLIMVYIGSIKKQFLIFGFIGAVILHILFNSVIAGVLV